MTWINKKKAFSYFDSQYGLKESNNGWYRFTFGDDDSLAVNFRKNVVKSFRHGVKMSIDKFLDAAVNDYQNVIERYKERDYLIPKALTKVQDKLPEGFLLLNEYHPLQAEVLKYIKDRKLDLELLEERGVGYCTKGRFTQRLIFPFLNPQFEYYTGRTIVPGVIPKYLNPSKGKDLNKGKSEVIYNRPALLNDTVYLGEGVLDALVYEDEGICCLGWSVSPTQFSTIVNSPVKTLCIVPDSGFYKKALLLAYKFSDYKNVRIANLEHYEEGTDALDIGRDNIEFKDFKISMLHEETS